MPDGFDFAVWLRLACTDPVGFEAARREAVEAAIAIGRDSDHLRRVQWRIDAERQRARTPLKACLRISSLMWERFFEFQTVLNRTVGYEVDQARASTRRQAQILRLGEIVTHKQ